MHRACDACRPQFAVTAIPITHYRILRMEQQAATAPCVANQQPDALRKQQPRTVRFAHRAGMQPSAARRKTAECAVDRSTRQPGVGASLSRHGARAATLVAKIKAVVPTVDDTFSPGSSSGVHHGGGALARCDDYVGFASRLHLAAVSAPTPVGVILTPLAHRVALRSGCTAKPAALSKRKYALLRALAGDPTRVLTTSNLDPQRRQRTQGTQVNTTETPLPFLADHPPARLPAAGDASRL
jgi:hypothetical protein